MNNLQQTHVRHMKIQLRRYKDMHSPQHEFIFGHIPYVHIAIVVTFLGCFIGLGGWMGGWMGWTKRKTEKEEWEKSNKNKQQHQTKRCETMGLHHHPSHLLSIIICSLPFDFGQGFLTEPQHCSTSSHTIHRVSLVDDQSRNLLQLCFQGVHFSASL